MPEESQPRPPMLPSFNPPSLIGAAGIEVGASALAAQAQAAVQARYVMAMHRPRNWDQVRQDILRECRRPTFARNKSAFYRKPIGEGVEGLGIRFAEVAVRCMTNMLIETPTIFEDESKEVVRVQVTELESNTTYFLDVRVAKTVERSRPLDDGSYISVRRNSYGKAVYTVPANDDDLLNKRNALISKAMRACVLRLVPGDIQDEAEDTIKRIRLDEAARDPDAERKRIVDAFDSIGVRAADLTDYLGHDLGSCSPKELVDLRGIYGAIRDGELTWQALIEAREAEKPKGPPEDNGGGARKPGAPPGNGEGSRSGALKDKIRTRTGAKAQANAPPSGASADGDDIQQGSDEFRAAPGSQPSTEQRLRANFLTAIEAAQTIEQWHQVMASMPEDWRADLQEAAEARLTILQRREAGDEQTDQH